MTQAEYERALLLTKIEAQRFVLGLELRLARASFDPMGAVFSLLGVDRAAAGSLVASLGSLLGLREGLGGGAIVPLLVGALLPLVERLLSPGDLSVQEPQAGGTSSSRDPG